MKRKLIILMIMLLLLSIVTGCNKKNPEPAEDDYRIDYLVLVNKLNPLPSDWANSQNPEGNYVGVVSVFSDYHKATDSHKDYQWWLACNDEGDWDVVTSEGQ